MSPSLALILSLLALGYLARRFARFPENASEVLNRFVIDLCVPATLLRVLPTLQFRRELVVLVATPWLLAALAFVIARLAARTLSLDRPTEAVLFLCTALGNTSFLGFPLCAALLGDGSVPLAAVYDQVGTFLILSLITPVLIARASGSVPPTLRQTAKRVVSFPPFIALAVALLPLPRPPMLDAALGMLAAALIPVATFAVGLRLRITPPKQFSAFALGLAVKLGVFPLLVWSVLSLLRPPHAIFEVAVLEAAMPASVTAGAIAMAAGLGTELAAALVGWGVLAALVSVPLWAALLH